MKLVTLDNSARRSAGYCWTFALSRPGPGAGALHADAMNASELMFFYGAPLAHVVAYEAELKAIRNGRTAREATRGRRPPCFHWQPAQAQALEPALAG